MFPLLIKIEAAFVPSTNKSDAVGVSPVSDITCIPEICNFSSGVFVPIPMLPLVSILMASVLLVRMDSGCESLVPSTPSAPKELPPCCQKLLDRRPPRLVLVFTPFTAPVSSPVEVA